MGHGVSAASKRQGRSKEPAACQSHTPRLHVAQEIRSASESPPGSQAVNVSPSPGPQFPNEPLINSGLILLQSPDLARSRGCFLWYKQSCLFESNLKFSCMPRQVQRDKCDFGDGRFSPVLLTSRCQLGTFADAFVIVCILRAEVASRLTEATGFACCSRVTFKVYPVRFDMGDSTCGKIVSASAGKGLRPAAAPLTGDKHVSQVYHKQDLSRKSGQHFMCNGAESLMTCFFWLRSFQRFILSNMNLMMS